MITMSNYATFRRVCAVASIFGLATLAGAGCDLAGPGFGRGQIPEITSFTVSPGSAAEGATLTFVVEAEDDAGVESINIQLRGAFEQDVTVNLETAGTDITDSAQVEIPTGTVSEILTAVARVTATSISPNPLQLGRRSGNPSAATVST